MPFLLKSEERIFDFFNFVRLCKGNIMKTPHDLVTDAKSHITEISITEASNACSNADIVIDVREPAEFNAGHIPQAINIPRGLLEFKILDLVSSADANIVLCCKTSGRAALAAQSLKTLGFTEPKSIADGFEAWLAAGLPTDKPNSGIDFD